MHMRTRIANVVMYDLMLAAGDCSISANRSCMPTCIPCGLIRKDPVRPATVAGLLFTSCIVQLVVLDVESRLVTVFNACAMPYGRGPD